MKNRVFSAVVNAVTAVLVLVSWLYMMGLGQSGAFSSTGWAAFRFYTVLSNLLEGVAAAILAVWLLTAGRHRAMPAWLVTLNLAATASVALTFTMVAVYLGPVLGYAEMLKGANLYFHLIVPLLAVFDFTALRDAKVRFPLDPLLAVAPTLLYGFYYVINILVNGADRGDWYMLTRAGPLVTVLVMAGLLIGVWLLAVIISLPLTCRKIRAMIPRR